MQITLWPVREYVAKRERVASDPGWGGSGGKAEPRKHVRHMGTKKYLREKEKEWGKEGRMSHHGIKDER